VEMQDDIKFNKEKFKEMVLYVASRLAGDPSNGSIKLNKALALSEFLHYKRFGTPIAGAVYVREPYGPAPRGMLDIQRELTDAGDAALVVVGFPQTQKMLFPEREPDLSEFSANEIATIASIVDLLADKTAMQSSDLAHEMLLGWQIAPDKEIIPYSTVFLYDGPLPEPVGLRAKQLAEELGDRVTAAAAT
jgi:hypothetical protein